MIKAAVHSNSNWSLWKEKKISINLFPKSPKLGGSFPLGSSWRCGRGTRGNAQCVEPQEIYTSTTSYLGRGVVPPVHRKTSSSSAASTICRSAIELSSWKLNTVLKKSSARRDRRQFPSESRSFPCCFLDALQSLPQRDRD